MKNIEEELKNFKLEISLKYKTSTTNFIYLRLSGLDNSIKNIEDQVKDAVNKIKADFEKLLSTYPNLKKEGFMPFIEVKSAYKDSIRDEFIDLYSNYLLMT